MSGSSRKRYYLTSLTGDGSYENPIRPDLPVGIIGYSALIPVGADRALVLVLAEESVHDEIKLRYIEIPLEEIQSRARELDARLTRWEADVGP